IVGIGSELLNPFRKDTNLLYLTEKVNEVGVDVIFKTIVGDNRQHLQSAAEMALSRGDLIIFMGGLGPTEDDLTREAVAEVLGLQLHRDDELLAKLEKRFAKHRIKMSPTTDRKSVV